MVKCVNLFNIISSLFSCSAVELIAIASAFVFWAFMLTSNILAALFILFRNF